MSQIIDFQIPISCYRDVLDLFDDVSLNYESFTSSDCKDEVISDASFCFKIRENIYNKPKYTSI